MFSLPLVTPTAMPVACHMTENLKMLKTC